MSLPLKSFADVMRGHVEAAGLDWDKMVAHGRSLIDEEEEWVNGLVAAMVAVTTEEEARKIVDEWGIEFVRYR